MEKRMAGQAAVGRRGFMRRVALLGAPLIVPARLFGQEAPSRTLHVGIVGSGTRCAAHTAEFSRIPGVRVVAVCDIWTERTRAAKARVNRANGDTHCRAYHDFRELVADPEVDIVAVAVPDHWHALVAVEAAYHGKHIYLDKPFAYSVEEGRAIVDAVHLNGVMLQHGTQQRSASTFQRATYLARHGYLGRVEKVYAISPNGPQDGDPTRAHPPEGYDFDFFTGPAPRVPFFTELALRPGTPGWYFTSVFGGGWVTAWGSHHVDSAQFALGKDHEAPVRVEAEGSYPDAGAWDTAYEWVAEFTYADDSKLIYTTPNRPGCPRAGREILVVGDEGWVAADRLSVYSNPPGLVERVWPEDDPTLQLMDRGGQSDHFRNFIDVIRDGVHQNAPMEAGHLSTTLCHLTNIGIQVQRPLRWDATEEAFVKDAQANRLLGRPMRAPWKLQG